MSTPNRRPGLRPGAVLAAVAFAGLLAFAGGGPAHADTPIGPKGGSALGHGHKPRGVMNVPSPKPKPKPTPTPTPTATPKLSPPGHHPARKGPVTDCGTRATTGSATRHPGRQGAKTVSRRRHRRPCQRAGRAHTARGPLAVAKVDHGTAHVTAHPKITRLPFTGAPTGLLTALALAGLTVGGALILLSRRRVH